MFFHNLPRDEQPKSGASFAAFRRKKRRENLIADLRRNAMPGISQPDGHMRLLLRNMDNKRTGFAANRFNRVANQMPPDEHQSGWLTRNCRRRLVMPRQLKVFGQF